MTSRWEDGGCLPIPLGSVWITGKCMLRCRHCYEAHNQKGMFHIPTDDAKLVLDRLAPHVKSISFMGGEPTLHPDLPELCRYAQSLGKYTLLVSNGVHFPEHLVERLEGHVDCIKLGMDGVTAETHDAVRGQGSFEKVMRTWGTLSRRITTMCKYTINAMNINQLPLVADFYQNLGARRLVLNGWLKIGAGADVWNRRFALSRQHMREIQDYVLGVLKPRYNIFPISRSCSLDGGCKELPARTYYVTRVGSVSPCIFSAGLAVGNILDPEVNVETLLARVNRLRDRYTNLHTQEKSGKAETADRLTSLSFASAGCPH